MPFWKRLHDFFMYPFQTGPMALLGLAILSSVVFSSGLFALLAAILIVLLQIKYGFNVIASMTEGEFEAPSLSATIKEGGYDVVIKQFAIVVFMLIATTSISAELSPVIGVPLGVFFVLVLPMSTILLASERSLRAALNPVTLVTSIYRIGWPYLLVYLYLLMMFSSSIAFGQMMFEYVGVEAARVITSASGYYFVLVMYSLMGYMIYQYRHQLQVGSPYQDISIAPPASGEDPRVHVLLQQGEYPRALDLLVSDWKSHDRPLAMVEKYVRVAQFSGAWEHLRSCLMPLLAKLLKAENTVMMPRLLRDLLAAQPDVEINNTALALQVAGAVRERGDSKLAARLLKNQHKLTKDPVLQREAIGMLAEILEADLRQPGIAAKYRALSERIAAQSAPDDDGLNLVKD